MTDLTSLQSVPQWHRNRSSTPRRLPANCHVFRCPLAQFERRFIAERTRDGMNAARAKGSRPLRPPLNPEKPEATLLLVKGGMSPTRTARRTALVSCPRNTRYFVAIKMGRRQGGPSRTGGGGSISEPIRDRPATQPPAHFHRNPLGRGQLAVFPRCSLDPYDSDIGRFSASPARTALKNSQLTSGKVPRI